MNIKEILRKKIIKEVLTLYKADWSVLVYDKTAGEIMIDLFTKSELNDYSISEAFLINANKPEWDFPAVYFILGTKANYDQINEEFDNKTFSKYTVIILDLIDDYNGYLNEIIKTTVLSCNLNVLEERIFTCEYKNVIKSLEFVLDTTFTIYKMPCIKQLPPFTETGKNDNPSDFLILERSFDLFTPLIHFFTFKSILSEIYPDTDLDDHYKLYKEIRYRHMAEIHKILQYNINKLNKNMEQLDKKLSTTELSKMVLDAPDNIKMKESIEKYSNYLRDAFTRLEYLQETLSDDKNFNCLIEAELILATGNKEGNRVSIDLSLLFDLLASTQLQRPDKLRLLYLIKFRGLGLTVTERSILKQSGFSSEDIDCKLDLSNKYKRAMEKEYKYEISRFEPFLTDIINDAMMGDFKSFLIKANNLDFSKKAEEVFSLRKTKMLTIKKKSVNRRKIVIYIKNGMTVEECRLAYDLSEALGIELFLGSDKMLKPTEILETIKNEYAVKQNEKI